MRPLDFRDLIHRQTEAHRAQHPLRLLRGPHAHDGRGYRRMPASFHSDEMRMSPPGHFFDVMTNGFGSMPPYTNQIAARDRWAITAYIRALQLSQWATLDSVPEDERRRLEQERR